MRSGQSKGFISLLRDNPAIVVVCVSTVLSMMGQGIILPVLPLFAKDFGISVTGVGAVVGVFGLGRLLSNMPAGFLSQKFGRRLVMGSGLTLSALGSAMMGTADGVPELIGWRLLAGIGAALFVTGGFAYITDISTPENRGKFMSLQQGSLLIGVNLGPVVGGFVADFAGFRWPFYLTGILIGIAAVWTLTRLPEYRLSLSGGRNPAPKAAHPVKSGDLRAIGNLLSTPTFLAVGIFTLLIFFTRAGSLHSIIPLRASNELTMSASQLGILFFVSTAMNMLLILPVGAFTDRIGRKAIVLPGAALTFGALLLFANGDYIWLFFLAAAIQGLGSGMAGPAIAAYAGDLAPRQKAGVAMGVYRSFGDMGFVLGPVLLGWIADHTSLGGAITSNATMLLAAALLLLIMARETVGRSRTGKPRPAPEEEDDLRR